MLPAKIHKEIVDFLKSLPAINDIHAQQAVISRAALDAQLYSQIEFSLPSAQFFELLIPQLIQYGELDDGRNALEAVLQSARDFIGHNKRAYCDLLIQQVHTNSNEVYT